MSTVSTIDINLGLYISFENDKTKLDAAEKLELRKVNVYSTE